MSIHLTPEQEKRVQAVLRQGSYDSVEEIVEAAVSAVEQRAKPGFRGSAAELDSLLAEGLASNPVSENDFWSGVDRDTNTMLSEHKGNRRS